jgi:hypothetical protein
VERGWRLTADHLDVADRDVSPGLLVLSFIRALRTLGPRLVHSDAQPRLKPWATSNILAMHHYDRDAL